MNPVVQPLFPPTVLVTGGAGFIGSAVVRMLIAQTQVRVVNLDKLTYAACPRSLDCVANSPRYAFVEGDIACPDTVHAVFSTLRPDVIMHLAAESHVDRSIDGPGDFVTTNIHGTYTLLEAARRHFESLDEARQEQFMFLHVSTDEIFGSLGSEGRFTEDSPVKPSSPYSASKASADHLVRAWHTTYGLPTVITNCSNNYGPHQFPEKLIPLMILRALSGKPLPIYGSGLQVRDWLHVEDHATALWRAAREGQAGREYLIGGDSERTNLQVVHAICEVLDERFPDRAPHARLIEHVDDRPGHDHRYAIDASRIRRELGWQPMHDFKTGLTQTVQWYLDNPGWWQPLQERYECQRLGLGK